MNSFHFSALKENTGQKNHKNKINLSRTWSAEATFLVIIWKKCLQGIRNFRWVWLMRIRWLRPELLYCSILWASLVYLCDRGCQRSEWYCRKLFKTLSVKKWNNKSLKSKIKRCIINQKLCLSCQLLTWRLSNYNRRLCWLRSQASLYSNQS